MKSVAVLLMPVSRRLLLALALVTLATPVPAGASETNLVEAEEAPMSDPAAWEALGLKPHEQRLLAGLGFPIAMAMVGTPIVPGPLQTGLFYGMCYGAGMCPDSEATFAFYMIESPLVAIGFSGMFAWAEGEDRGWRTGLRGLPLLRWREGLQRMAMGVTLMLTASLMTYGDPAWKPIENYGFVGWCSGLPTAALGVLLFIEGQIAMDRQLGRRRSISPAPIIFGLSIFVPKLIVGILALAGGISVCEIVDIEEYENGAVGYLHTCSSDPLPRLGWPSLGFAAASAALVILELTTTGPAGSDATLHSSRRASARTAPGFTLWPAPQLYEDNGRLNVGLGVAGRW